MDTLFKKLALIPNDKLLHSFYGTCIYILCSFINPLFAIIFVIIVAVVKELYDEFAYGGFDWKDLLVTMLIPTLIYIKDVYSG